MANASRKKFLNIFVNDSEGVRLRLESDSDGGWKKRKLFGYLVTVSYFCAGNYSILHYL